MSKSVHGILRETVEPIKILVVDLSQKCIIPYIEGHKLPEVHDVIKRIACFVIRREFWHYEPPRLLIVNNMRAKRREEHVIQPSADRVGRSSNRLGLSLLLPWWLRGLFRHNYCG